MSEHERSAQEKRRQLQVMLDAGLVMLHLDPRAAEVIVPPQFKGDPVLRLNLAWGFNLPALEVGDDGVYAVLSFNRQNFGCTLPWACIFAMTAPDAGHEGVVWPESVPAELAPYFQAAGQAPGGVPVSLRAEERPRRPAELKPRRAPTRPPEAMPEAALAKDEAAADARAPSGVPGALPGGELRERPLFIVHEGGRADDEPPTPPAAPPEGGAPRPRPNLRLVKD